MQTIVKWERDAMPVAQRGRPGRPSLYDIDAVIRWRAMRDAAAESPDALSLQRERALKERAQRELALQTYASRAGELIPRAAAVKVWVRHIEAARSLALAWPTSLVDRLHRACALEGLTGMQHVLEEAVHDFLTELVEDPFGERGRGGGSMNGDGPR